MAKRVTIRFDASGEGTISGAFGQYKCLGQVGRRYPRDITVKGVEGTDKFPNWVSSEFAGVSMPWSVLIWGQKGIFIHEGADTLAGNGGGGSAGCIHLAQGNARAFYDWVDGPTRIVISYPW